MHEATAQAELQTFSGNKRMAFRIFPSAFLLHVALATVLGSFIGRFKLAGCPAPCHD